MKKLLDEKNWMEALLATNSSRKYRVMYSSVVDGFVKNPNMMVVPVDDHLVHRGDGVFEAIRLIEGKVYLLDEHLARLERSGKAIGMKVPMTASELKSLIVQACQLSELRDGMIRLFVSRGPGDFSTNPYTTKGAQIYLVVTEFSPMDEKKYQEGVSVIKSQVAPKIPFFATMKTCNYLPNVLMKKEAVDLNCDFSIGVTSAGFVLESSTENIGLVDESGVLVHPPYSDVLQGCTMTRSFELAQKHMSSSFKGIDVRPIQFDELFTAKEIMMFGTTLDVLPVCFIEEEPVGSGDVGPLAKKLRELLRKDQQENGLSIG